MSLSKRAQHFQDMLNQRGLNLTVQELPDSTRTADDAARALNCEKAQIVKSLVFRTESNSPVLVLASGPTRVNEKAIERILGEPLSKADAGFVKAVTGFAIGGVPPFGHKEPIQLFVDEDLLRFDELWAAAGTPNAVFKIPGDLCAILPDHQVICVK
ncbi:YbaK/EbsC family protein [Ectopseudomonas mendocina]|uniref:YbaK/EbsC family protein n=1 Tax=Ectopseudomonas mendocina TaxID=300 RepID=A0ABZ2RB81_ECTME